MMPLHYVRHETRGGLLPSAASQQESAVVALIILLQSLYCGVKGSGYEMNARARARPRSNNGFSALLPGEINSISGLVVEYIVAIDVTRVRFPADALYFICPFLAIAIKTANQHALHVIMPPPSPGRFRSQKTSACRYQNGRASGELL